MESRPRWIITAALAAASISACAPPDRRCTAHKEPAMSIAQVTPEEAKRLLDAGGYVYLDVRTVPEFVAGHPPTAYNVPVAELNPVTGEMKMNEKFLPVVQAAIPPDTQLIVGCRTGGRSAAAAE